MPKYKDAIRILKRRIEFFQGNVYEAGGKQLMYRVVASDPECLKKLEAIENQYEPTEYHYKPGHHVDFITEEICFFIGLIYDKLKNENGDTESASGSPPGSHPDTPRGGEPARKRLKTGDAGGARASAQ